MKKNLVYLATPYSHQDEEVRERRFLNVNKAAARLMAMGVFVFSPISHTHPIALAGNLPKGFDYWESYDRVLIGMCCELIVLKQDGWEESVGVQAEIKIAKELGLPIHYMENTNE